MVRNKALQLIILRPVIFSKTTFDRRSDRVIVVSTNMSELVEPKLKHNPRDLNIFICVVLKDYSSYHHKALCAEARAEKSIPGVRLRTEEVIRVNTHQVGFMNAQPQNRSRLMLPLSPHVLFKDNIERMK